MKSMITLILVGAVTLVCGQYFGWWHAPIPGMERVPSYQAKKGAREAERSARRRLVGLEDDEGNATQTDQMKDSKRRADALKQGKKVGSN